MVFALTFFLYTTGAFTLMYFYWRKSMTWRYKEHKHSEPFYENDLSLHTVLVQGLDK